MKKDKVKEIYDILEKDNRISYILDVLSRIIIQDIDLIFPRCIKTDQIDDIVTHFKWIKQKMKLYQMVKDLLSYGFVILNKVDDDDYSYYDCISPLFPFSSEFVVVNSKDGLDIQKMHNMEGVDFINEIPISNYYFDKVSLNQKDFDNFYEFLRRIRNQFKDIILSLLKDKYGNIIQQCDIIFSDDETEKILEKIMMLDDMSEPIIGYGLLHDKKYGKVKILPTSENKEITVGYGFLHDKEYGKIKIDRKNDSKNKVYYDDELGQLCINGQWQIPFDKKYEKDGRINLDKIHEDIQKMKQFFVEEQKYELASYSRDCEKIFEKIIEIEKG